MTKPLGVANILIAKGYKCYKCYKFIILDCIRKMITFLSAAFLLNDIIRLPMGWYGFVYNYTRRELSSDKYKYGDAPLALILRDNPYWSASEIIIGGGQELMAMYHLIAGSHTHELINLQDDVFPIYSYEIRFKALKL